MESNRLASWVVLSSFMTAVALAAPTPVAVRTVTALDRTEAYAPLLFHAGVLWTGRNRLNGALHYRLEVFSPDGRTKVADLPLTHSISTIHAYGANQAIVVGKSYTDQWRTHYTTATYRNGRLTGSTYTFSTSYMVDEAAAGTAGLFFGEPGSQAVLRLGTFGPRVVGGPVSGPGVMALAGQRLFVLERKGPALGDENLVRIDLSSNQVSRTFPGDRAGLVSVLTLASGGHVAVAEHLANQVLLVDVGINRVSATIAVPAGQPRALAQLGHCLVVGTDDGEKKIVSFFDLASPQRSLVDEWDLGAADRNFASIYAIAVDAQSGRVFARSKRPCLECAVSGNYVIVAEQRADEARRRCTQ